MSAQTPQTDAEAVRFARIMIEWDKPRDKQVTELIPADFARFLEVSLAHYKALCEELREALKGAQELFLHAKFENGVTDQAGRSEADYWAVEWKEQARAALKKASDI